MTDISKDKGLIIIIFFLLVLLIYQLMPGPASISDFQALPNSEKSTLSGDTVQVPNVTAYFSDNYRDFATQFYKNMYFKMTALPLPPIRLNYPPEYAFTAIKDQTQSTYLEEYVYPLRDSLFVNGLEPFEQSGKARFWGANQFEVNGKKFDTKVTLRYYPSSISSRVIVWVGISLSTILLWKIGKKIVFNA